MSYGLNYTVPFATLDNIPCVVEIEKEGYTGESTELIAGETPFTVDLDSEEFLYTPTRFSTAKLQIVGNDYLQTLFSTEYRQCRVTFKKDGVITWCGFIKPELYTQDFSSETFILEIECFSAMSVLEFIDYTTEGENKEFVSLWRLLQRCISASYGLYPAIHIPHVYAADKTEYAAGGNILSRMLVSEQNFFDEDNKPMKLKEVLEEICKFLNWTCVDWRGELYFVDVDHSGVYHKYNASLTDKVDISKNSLIIQDVGFAGNGHSLDFLSGYNKVTVKCSNYPVSQLIPNADFGVKEMYDSYKTTNNEYTEEFYIKGMILSFWKVKAYREDFPLGSGNIYELTDEQVKISGARLNYNMGMGATAYKVGTVAAEKDGGGYKIIGENYSWKTLIRYKVADGIVGRPILIVKGAVAPYMHGAIEIEAGILFTTNYSEPHKVTIQEFHVLKFSLKIGREYWNGSSWQTAEATFDVGIGEIGKDVESTSLRGTKTADMPYEGLTGYIVKLPDDRVLVGELELVMYAVNYPYQMDKRISIIDIENLKLSYQKKDDVRDEGNDSDRTYENVLNENYINELDEIELKISSYNNDGACYSKVMLGGDYLKDNLYNVLLDKSKRIEELLITRIINHYSAPQIKLTQVIKNSDDISPLTILSDTFLVNKKFINAGGSIDYKMNRFECIMIEV